MVKIFSEKMLKNIQYYNKAEERWWRLEQNTETKLLIWAFWAESFDEIFKLKSFKIESFSGVLMQKLKGKLLLHYVVKSF